MAEVRRTDFGKDGTGEKWSGRAKGEAADQLRQVLHRASAVERDLVLEARTRGEVSAATADEALRDIEVRALRDFG